MKTWMGTFLNGVPVEEKSGTLGEGEKIVYIDTKDKIPKDFSITKKDAEKHGYTSGCAGCSSWFRGLGRQPHSAKCRERFREILKDTAKYQNTIAKKEEFDRRQQEKRDRKEEKIRVKMAKYIEKQDRKEQKRKEREERDRVEGEWG